jgi:hypothetical protein
MNTSNSTDKVMNEMNDWAKAEGRYLGKAFWEIPSQMDSILDVPLTPEAEQRIAALRARRLERSKKVAEQSEAVAAPEDANEEHTREKITEGIPAEQGGRDGP